MIPNLFLELQHGTHHFSRALSKLTNLIVSSLLQKKHQAMGTCQFGSAPVIPIATRFDQFFPSLHEFGHMDLMDYDLNNISKQF